MPIDMARHPSDLLTWTFLALCCVALDAAAAGPARGQEFDVYTPHPTGIEIHEFRSGVVCLEDDEPSHVCREAYTIPIVGDAVCEWSKDVDYPCTWYGHEFDVRNVETDMLVVCEVANSIRTVFGPETEKVTGRNTAQYTIELEAGQRHVFHPSYHTYGPVEEETAVITVHTCSVDGVPLYRVSFRAFYEPE